MRRLTTPPISLLAALIGVVWPLHAPGQPFKHSAVLASAASTNLPAFRRATLAIYVRQEGAHFAIDDLMVPKIFDLGRPVKVSSDPRQRLCTSTSS